MMETAGATTDREKTLSDNVEVKTVHIDTSLQIEQQKIPTQSLPVRTALARYAFRSTSTYAKKEFKRAWLQDLNLIYKTAKDCADLGDVLAKIESSLWKPEAKRRRSRCVSAIAAFLKNLPAGTPVSVLVTRLRAHIAEAILTGFMAWERSVTHEHDGTQCTRARERPVRASNGTIDVTVRDCKPSKIQCAVHIFFGAKEKEFRKILDKIDGNETASFELQNTKRVIEAAIKDSKILCDNSKCSAMGDALIAVDGVEMDHFAANNPREWQTLAAALGKPLINPVADSKDAKARSS